MLLLTGTLSQLLGICHKQQQTGLPNLLARRPKVGPVLSSTHKHSSKFHYIASKASSRVTQLLLQHPSLCTIAASRCVFNIKRSYRSRYRTLAKSLTHSLQVTAPYSIQLLASISVVPYKSIYVWCGESENYKEGERANKLDLLLMTFHPRPGLNLIAFSPFYP
jgi:hypothetical protein